MEQKNKESLPLIYVLGLPMLLIIATYMARLSFTILKTPLFIGTFIYPLTYLMTFIVIKKTSQRNALNIMAISIVSQALSFIVSWTLLNSMDYALMIATFMSFVINQLIVIVMYDFLVSVKQDTYCMLFFVLLLISAIDTVIFGCFIEGKVIGLSILIRLAYCVIIPALIAKKVSNK